MTDRRFDEVVLEGQSIGYHESRGYRALCGDCGEYQEARIREWKYGGLLVDTEELAYVAKMRAWNCCNEGEEPLDGFPDDPREE